MLSCSSSICRTCLPDHSSDTMIPDRHRTKTHPLRQPFSSAAWRVFISLCAAMVSGTNGRFLFYSANRQDCGTFRTNGYSPTTLSILPSPRIILEAPGLNKRNFQMLPEVAVGSTATISVRGYGTMHDIFNTEKSKRILKYHLRLPVLLCSSAALSILDWAKIIQITAPEAHDTASLLVFHPEQTQRKR